MDGAHELHRYGAGLRALRDLAPELIGRRALTTLNLHGNALREVDGESIAPLVPALDALNLSSNELESMAGVGSFGALTVLDLSSNRLARIDGLARLHQLARLSLAYNHLTSLAGLVAAHGGPLRHLDVRGNRISSTHELYYLDGLGALQVCARARTPAAPGGGGGPTGAAADSAAVSRAASLG